MKLLVIGFDAMDSSLAYQVIGQRLKKYCKPLSVDIAVTGPSWASFYTGKSQSEHGVTHSWGLNQNGSKCFDDIKDDCFWEIIKKNGFTVYTDNLPITPSGFPFCHVIHKDLINKVALGENNANWRASLLEKGFPEVFEIIKKNVFKLIDETKAKDLTFIQFPFLDRIGHSFGYSDDLVIHESYKFAFKTIKNLLDKFKPEKFLVVSDHGFPRKGYNHFKSFFGVCITDFEIDDLIVKQTELFNVILKHFGIERNNNGSYSSSYIKS